MCHMNEKTKRKKNIFGDRPAIFKGNWSKHYQKSNFKFLQAQKNDSQKIRGNTPSSFLVIAVQSRKKSAGASSVKHSIWK